MAKNRLDLPLICRLVEDAVATENTGELKTYGAYVECEYRIVCKLPYGEFVVKCTDEDLTNSFDHIFKKQITDGLHSIWAKAA